MSYGPALAIWLEAIEFLGRLIGLIIGTLSLWRSRAATFARARYAFAGQLVAGSTRELVMQKEILRPFPPRFR